MIPLRPCGEAIYLQDLDTNQVWTPTALPIRGPGAYIARHGFGYTLFEHESHGIAASMEQFVPLDRLSRSSRLTLRNTSLTVRKLSVTAYAEWVLGTSRSATSAYVITKPEPATGAILAQNTFSTAFPGRVAFADLGAGTSSVTADRAEFIGLGGTLAAPAAINGQAAFWSHGPRTRSLRCLAAPGDLATWRNGRDRFSDRSGRQRSSCQRADPADAGCRP